MKRCLRNSIACCLLVAGCVSPTEPGGDPGLEPMDLPGAEPVADVSTAEPLDDESIALAASAAVTCTSPSLLKYYPVRGRHDNGYQSSPSAGSSSHWTCNDAYSNSDFFTSSSCASGGGHYGNDIWAAEGTPVVATLSGQIVESRYSSYSGNIVTIRDACGWSHFAIHMKSIASGMTVGRWVIAGEVIGYVGKTGSASNGVVHLHYSIYPGQGNYCRGISPWPRLHAVESDVCWTPAKCGSTVCGKDQFCWGTRCCPLNSCTGGCPCALDGGGDEPAT